MPIHEHCYSYWRVSHTSTSTYSNSCHLIGSSRAVYADSLIYRLEIETRKKLLSHGHFSIDPPAASGRHDYIIFE